MVAEICRAIVCDGLRPDSVRQTETFSESTSITGDIWIGNDNTGVFTESQAFVWASADGTLNAGATLTGWLRIADWGGTEEKPLYGNLEIQSGSYSAGGFTVGGTTAAYTYSWATLSGGLLTVPSVSVGSTSENAGTATLTLNGGTLATTSVTGSGTLAVGANGGTFANDAAATISVALTGSGTLTKTGAGELTISGDVTGFTGKIVVAAGAGYVTIAALGVTVNEGEEFQFGAYYWTGAGTETTVIDEQTQEESTTYANKNVWANLDNWLVNGKVPTALPTATSTVIIPAGDGSALTIKCAYATDYTGYLTINRDVTLARAEPSNTKGPNGIHLTQVDGTGTLTLAGSNRSSGDAEQDRFKLYRGSADLPFVINTDLNTTGRIRCMDSSGAPKLTLNGALKGDGIIYFDNHSNYEGFVFNGDTSEFSGEYTGCSAGDWARDATRFAGDARGSALASWHIGRGNSGSDGYTPFLVNSATYQFGQLTAPKMHFWRGYTGSNTTGATIEVGALAGKTSTVTGSLSPSGNTLRKVGATSTLEYTNEGTAGGTVEAYEGTTVIKGTATGFTLKFSGADAIIKIARSTTTETTVEPEEEGGEATTTTTTTDNIPSTFVPGFTDALVGCQYEVTQETVDNVTYDVYTVLTDVATDSADRVYNSVALALAAIAADETGTLTKVVTLAKSTTEAVTLPLGYSLALNGNAIGSVVGATGVGVAYDEATDTWTTVDNTAATWVGGAEGNWFDAANWSTGYVPDEATRVSFKKNVTAFLDGNNTYHCDSIYLERGYTLTLAPVDYNEDNYPRVTVHGDIDSNGGCTLKLYRCGIDNAKGSTVTVRPTVEFYNTSGDSWMTGSFHLQASLTGTGEFRIYDANLSFPKDSGITVNAGSVVDFRTGYPEFAGSGGTISSAGLMGDGRVIVHAWPGKTNSSSAYLRAALVDSEKWTGTLELAGFAVESQNYYGRGINATNYGNANSTVCFNGTTGFLDFNNTTTVGDVKAIEIGANGLTLNEMLSDKAYVISADLTGTGTLTFGTQTEPGTRLTTYTFTGDASAFAGTLTFGGVAKPAAVVFNATGVEAPAAAAGQVAITAGTTLGVAGLNATVAGSGAIAYTSIAPATPATYGEAWAGSVVLPVTVISAKTSLALPTLSTANGTIVVKGITRENDQRSLYLGSGATCTIAGTTQLDGDLHITDGNSNATYTWNKITGTGNALLTTEGGSAAGITHAITTLDNYSGTITVGKNVTLTIGTINLASAPSAGDRLVKTAVSGTGASISVANTKVAVNGEEITEPETLLLKSDGIYYGTATSTAYDGGDGSTFTIDASVAAVMTTYLPEGATLASTVEGKTFTYAQAYALGLVSVENDALVVDDLTATIKVVDGKVVVSLGSTPETVYTVTCNVYENTSLTDTWSETPAHTYVVGSETEAAGFTPASDAAGFYKVGVTITNK